jgi:hypothetical protein
LGGKVRALPPLYNIKYKLVMPKASLFVAVSMP